MKKIPAELINFNYQKLNYHYYSPKEKNKNILDKFNFKNKYQKMNYFISVHFQNKKIIQSLKHSDDTLYHLKALCGNSKNGKSIIENYSNLSQSNLPYSYIKSLITLIRCFKARKIITVYFDKIDAGHGFAKAACIACILHSFCDLIKLINNLTDNIFYNLEIDQKKIILEFINNFLIYINEFSYNNSINILANLLLDDILDYYKNNKIIKSEMTILDCYDMLIHNIGVVVREINIFLNIYLNLNDATIKNIGVMYLDD